MRRKAQHEAVTAAVLVAVSPASLARVVDHLLRERTDLRVVAHVDRGEALTRQVARLAPRVVVAHQRVLGREPARRVAELKASSPGSKLVLVAPHEGLGPRLRHGADACVGEEELVERLAAAVAVAARRARGRRPRG